MSKESAERALDVRPREAAPRPVAADPAELSQSLKSVLASMQGDLSAEQRAIHRDIGEVIQSIETLHQEIRGLEPSRIWQEHIPEASDELDAIVQATEDATNRIMSAAEVIERVAGELDGDKSAELTDVVTSIYEACSFQDITGQRVKKVVRTLQHIEVVVGAMARHFGIDGSTSLPAAPRLDSDDPDAKLLNGPSLPSDAKTQADIDALFSS
ncbi:MAG: hypothetical protein U1F33_17950 [Alphaproteobacteria bacterium]